MNTSADNSTAPELIPPQLVPGLNGRHVMLASKSPRRRELLGMIVGDFDIADSREVEEVYPSDILAEEVPQYLSRLKAGAYRDLLGDKGIVITADTVVILDGKILGKPHDRHDAIEMLRSLSGRTHTVVTGVTVTSAEASRTIGVHTCVTFDHLEQSIIEDYVDTYRPYDKAGAYGIQEWIGAVGISGIEGCYYNVMGLPLHALARMLREMFPGE